MKKQLILVSLVIFNAQNFCIEPRGESLAIATAKDYMRLPGTFIEIISSAVDENKSAARNSFSLGDATLPLFTAFPRLHAELPYISLGSFPTPIEQISSLGNAIGLEHLYVKCDNLTGGYDADGAALFGGNKVRKLEFLLADALYNDTKSVITFGGAGSNHALATVTYAEQLGLKGIAILEPQKPSDIVKRNLSLDLHHNAELHLCDNQKIWDLCIAYTMLREKQINGTLPYIIPVGGSCPTGAIGFVNAVFELKQQIEAGVMPEPDYIYVTLGSMGTAAGLLLGVKAAGLKSKIVAVTVSHNPTWEKTVELAQKTNRFLHNADPSFPLFSFHKNDLTVLRNFVGKGYGIFTQGGCAAIDLIAETEGIVLDGVYTGKCLDGLIAQANKHKKDDVILFWNTFCGDDFAQMLQTVDYKNLPHCFHHYFEA
ncbi:1-aminocyclopropane-1-carboxylate deaminase/D-cysteine desulfhydrase [Candidatus Dependentiae bacterium]